MKKVFGWLFAAVLAFGFTMPTSAAPLTASGPDKAGRQDDKVHPLGQKERGLRQVAQEKVLKGQAVAKGKNKVVEVAKGQYVELAREGEDSILTVLGQFSNLAHNQIPEPDRSVDNTTIWAPDFSEAYFEDLLFSEAPGAISMRNFYIEQSSNRYTVNGDVTDWVTVPQTGAYYGSNSRSDAYAWLFVRDSVNAWANTMSTADLNAYLAQFDVWDRYDYDGDGNFDEPDGYIDHFQSVHSGMGEEVGGGVLGDDAIWSHRWYAYYYNAGVTGPSFNMLGGLRIGTSNYWIGDYTIEPENGGVGVFSHEFGHDLGLPDLYDTTYTGESASAFWTLMSSGSYGSSGKPEDGIGTEPMHMGAWEKFQLGWLNYEVGVAGKKSEHKVSPAEVTTKQAQGLFVVLPDRQVTTNIGSAYQGSKFYYSGSGNDLDNSMTKSVTLPAGSVTLTAKARYSIELDWDYAYLTVNGTPVATNLSTSTNPYGQNFGYGITGSSNGAWVDLTANLSAYAGQTVTLGFRYWTDGAAVESGLGLDAVAVNGTMIGSAEATEGWTFNGFTTTTGTTSTAYFNAYLAENRQYIGFDKSLQTGPYNFGFLNTKPDWVEHFPYQDGLLISYWNTQYTDNNVGSHPGGGLILPIDAHPTMLRNPSGTPWRTRIQVYDATFGLENTDAITLHVNGVGVTHPSLPAVPVFDDTKDWYDEAGNALQAGYANPPSTGTSIRVVSSSAGGFMQVQVAPVK